MPFTTAELWQIKAELGYNLLQTGAVAYIGVTQIFEQVINENIDAEIATTAVLSSPISEASSPTPQTLTLTSVTGFSAGAVVHLDVDERLERATIQSLTGSNIVVQLQKAHSGTIPVSLDGPIPLAKEILRKIRLTKDEMAETFGEGALKQVDEVKFYQQGDSSMFGLIGDQLRFWRNELASILGVTNMWELKPSTGGITSMSVY
jgi:hypothetical protein